MKKKNLIIIIAIVCVIIIGCIAFFLLTGKKGHSYYYKSYRVSYENGVLKKLDQDEDEIFESNKSCVIKKNECGIDQVKVIQDGILLIQKKGKNHYFFPIEFENYIDTEEFTVKDALYGNDQYEIYIINNEKIVIGGKNLDAKKFDYYYDQSMDDYFLITLMVYDETYDDYPQDFIYNIKDKSIYGYKKMNKEDAKFIDISKFTSKKSKKDEEE